MIAGRNLHKLLMNPPTGSKLRTAKDYGLDLTLYDTSLALTVEERLRRLEDAQSFHEELRIAVQRNKRKA